MRDLKIISEPKLGGKSFKGLSGYQQLMDLDTRPTQVGNLGYEPSSLTPSVLPQDLATLENRRAQLQPWYDKFGNGLVNMTSSAFTGALESTVGLVYGAGTALINQDANLLFNNEFGKSMDGINEYFRKTNPFYYTNAQKEASAFYGLTPFTSGSANFWFDKVMGGAGYTIGSLMAGYGAGRVFNIGKTARLAQLEMEASATAAAAGIEGAAANYARWDMAKQVALSTTMAHGESSMEARQTYKEKLEFLADARERGKRGEIGYEKYASLTNEQMYSQARDASNTNYLMNLAITGPTDYILLGKFINPGKRNAVRTYNEIGKKTAVDGTVEYFDKTLKQKGRAYLNAADSFMKGFLPESFQEGMQFASNIASQKFVDKHGLDGTNWFESIVSSMAEGLEQTVSTTEGLQSILIGGIVGGPFGMRGAKATQLAQDERTKQLVDALNKDIDFMSSLKPVNDFVTAVKKTNKAEEHLKNGDIFQAKNETDEAFSTYVKGHIEKGSVDYFIAKLEGLKDMGQEEIEKFYGPGTTPEDIDKVIEKTNKLVNLYESIETLYGTPGGTDAQKRTMAILRENLYDAAATIKNTEDRMEAIRKELQDMRDPDINNLLSLRAAAISVSRTTFPEKDMPEGMDYDEYLMDQQNLAIQMYNDAKKKYEAEHPVENTGVNDLLADLNKLDDRKAQFVQYYNALNNPERAAKLGQLFEKKMGEMLEQVEQLNNTKDQQNAAQTLNIQTVDTMVKPNPDRTNVVNINGKEVDLSKVDDEQLNALFEELSSASFNAQLNQNVEEGLAYGKIVEQVKAEQQLRVSADEVLKQIKDELLKARTLEDIDRVLAAVQSQYGDIFQIDELELQKFKANTAKIAELDQKQKDYLANIDSNFKGIYEFQDMFQEKNSAQIENLVEALGRPDAANKMYFKLRKEPTFGELRDIGTKGNPNYNPRLKKKVPGVVIEVWSGDGTMRPLQLGVMPWYGQYYTAAGEEVVVETLTEEQYTTLFLPNKALPNQFSLAEFKAAHAASKELYTQVSMLLGDLDELTLTPEQSRKLADVKITGGRYNIEDVETPISKMLDSDAQTRPFIMVDENGVSKNSPVIVSLSKFDGTTTDFDYYKSVITESSAVASITDANGNPVIYNKMGNIDHRLLPALNELKKRKTNPRVGETIWNKYWMLVEDDAGSITIEGSDKKYDWRPLTSRSLNEQERRDAFAKLIELNEKAKTKDEDGTIASKTAFSDLTKEANDQVFIALKAPDVSRKSFGNSTIGFVASKKGLAVKLDLQFKSPIAVPEGKIYSGSIWMDIPADIKSFDDFIPWFNKQLEASGFEMRYTVKLADKSKVAGRMSYGASLSESFAPLNHSSLRKNFISDDVIVVKAGKAEKIKGIKSITPDNVFDSFSTHVSVTKSRVDQKVRVVPKAGAASSVNVIVPQPTANPVPTVNNSFKQIIDAVLAFTGVKRDLRPSGNYYNEYVDGKPNGVSIPRVSTMTGTFESKGDSQNRGTIIDSIFRDLINTSNVTPDLVKAVYDKLAPQYPDVRKFNNEMLSGIATTINTLRTQFGPSAQIIPNIPTLWGNLNNTLYAGTIDFLAIVPKEDGSTSVYIVDLKTSSQDRTDTKGQYYEEYRKKDIIQQNAYVELFRQRTGIKVDGIFTFPLQVDSTSNEYVKASSNPGPNGRHIHEVPMVALFPEQQSMVIPPQFSSGENTSAPAPTPQGSEPGTGTVSTPIWQRRGGTTAGAAKSSGNIENVFSEEELITARQGIENIKDLLPPYIRFSELTQSIENLKNGRITFGEFHNNVLRLAALFPKGREYHEAFHAIFRTVLTDSQIDGLYSEARGYMERQFRSEGKTYSKAYKEWKETRVDYAGLPEDIKKDLFIEEWMADEYPKWKQGKSIVKDKSLIQSFFDFLKRIGNWIKGTPSLDRLFRNIDEGIYSNMKAPVKNRFTSPMIDVTARSQIFVGDRVGTDGKTYPDYLDPEYELRIVNTIANKVISRLNSGEDIAPEAIVNEEMRKLALVFDIENPKYDALKNEAAAFMDKVNLILGLDFLFNSTDQSAIDSRNMLQEKIANTLKEYNVNEYDTSPDEDYDGQDGITERNFDNTYENVGGFGSLTKAMRKYIATTVYETSFDEFLGLEPGRLFGDERIVMAVNPKKVYDGLVKVAANQPTKSAVLRKMNYYRKNTSGEGQKFLSKFFHDAGVEFNDEGELIAYDKDKESLILRTVTGFNLYLVEYSFTEVSSGKATQDKKPVSRTYNAVTRGADWQQVEAWKGTYRNLLAQEGVDNVMKRAKAMEGIAAISRTEQLNDNELNELTKKISKGLKTIGINLSDMYIKYMILSSNMRQRTLAQENFVLEFQNSIKYSSEFFAESLTRIKQLVSEGVDIYETTKTETEEGAVSRLKKIALDNAVFDETVVMQTMINADGKAIYPYQQPNYHSQKVRELQEILKDPNEDLDYDTLKRIQKEQPNTDFLQGNYLLENPAFRALAPTMAAGKMDGLRQRTLEEKNGELQATRDNSAREGVTYGSMSERELLVNMYSYIADSNTDVTRVVINQEAKTKTLKKEVVRRMLFTIMEASNTANTLNLPMQTMYVNGKFTQVFKEAVFNEIKREYDRIQRVKNDAYADSYVGYNAYGDPDELRGLKFWEFGRMLDTMGLRTSLEQGEITLEEARDQIMQKMDGYFRQELEDHIEQLKETGILDKDGNNRLLHRKFEGLTEDDPFFGKDLNDNIANAYFNIYLNSIAVNQILKGDPALGLKNEIDWFKRAKGDNAAGPNLTHFDDALNAPFRLATMGVVNQDGSLGDPVNTEYTMHSNRIIRVNDENGEISRELNEFLDEMARENNWGPERRQQEMDTILASNRTQIEIMNAQAYTTTRGMLRFLTNLGRMTPRGREIFRNIQNGVVNPRTGFTVSEDDWQYLIDHDLMPNSLKLVYYDGTTYVKMSVAKLSEEFTTNRDGSPMMHRQFLHNLRENMDRLNIDMVGPPTMMKKMIKNPVTITPDLDNNVVINEENVQHLEMGYLKLQQENPSNKKQIKDPTQMMPLITAEHKLTDPVDFPWDPSVTTVGQLTEWVDKKQSERVKNAFHSARAFLLVLNNNNTRSINLKRMVKVFRKTLMETGASQQLLDYLRTDSQGNPMENLNAPAIVTAFEQHFNAYFNKVFSQKIPGYKATLQSDMGVSVIYDKSTGKVITTPQYRMEPSKYENNDQYGIRRLAFDVPHYENGKEVYKYTEVILPFHFAEQFGLKPGDEIPIKIQDMFGLRIPSQDKHSARVLRVVDVLPPTYGSNIITAMELVLLMGSDFDVDSLFIHRYDHYIDNNGEFKIYGNEEDPKWEQFVRWQRANNVFVKDLIDEYVEEDDVLDITGIRKEIKDLYKLKRRIAKIDDAVTEAGLAGKGYDGISEEDGKLLARRPEIRKKLEASRKELDDYMMQLSLKAMRELELPASEEEFKKSGMTSIGELNNDLLRAKMVLHSTPFQQNINKTPATLDSIKKVLDEFASALGYKSWKNLEKTYSANSVLGMVKAFVNNKAGQTAIGAAVNNTQNYALITRFGLAYNGKDGVDRVTINGITVGDITNNTFLTADMVRIMDILSSLTTSMTDNVKTGYNAKLNIDINTLSVVSLLVMNRIPLKDALLLVNAEYVVKYNKESVQYAIMSENEQNFQESADIRVKNELFRKIQELDKSLEGSAIAEMMREPLTQKDYELMIKYSSKRTEFASASPMDKGKMLENIPVEYYISQLRFLHSYLTLHDNHVPEFIALSQVLKLTKGISSSSKETSFKGDEDLATNLKKLNIKLVETQQGWTFEKDTDGEPTLYDMVGLLKQHQLTGANLSVYAQKLQAQKEYFISQTDFAKSARNIISEGIRDKMKNADRTKAMTEMRRNLESFLMIKAWRHASQFKGNLNSYLYSSIAGMENMLDKEGKPLNIESLKTSLLAAHPELAKNMIFNSVFFAHENNTNKVYYNTFSKGNKGFERQLLTLMKILANSEGAPLIDFIMMHLIAKNGMQFKGNSPISLLPPSLQAEFGFSKLMDDYTPVLNTMEDAGYKRMFGVSRLELLEEFTEKFMRDINNGRYLKYVSKEVLRDYEFNEKVKTENPVIKTPNGFTVDLDHKVFQLEGVSENDLEALINGEATPKMTADDLQRRRNYAVMGGKKGFRFTPVRAEYVKKKTDKATGITKIEKNVTKVYSFPKYLKIGGEYYRLKEYVNVDNRFEKKNRFTTVPDIDGRYVGSAVTYEKVTAWGGYGTNTYGRSNEELEQMNYDKLKEMNKTETPVPGIVQGVEDSPNEMVTAGDIQPLPNIVQIPTFTSTSTSAAVLDPTNTQKPSDPGLTKEQMMMVKQAALAAKTMPTASGALETSRNMLVQTIKNMSNNDIVQFFTGNKEHNRAEYLVQSMRNPNGPTGLFAKIRSRGIPNNATVSAEAAAKGVKQYHANPDPKTGRPAIPFADAIIEEIQKATPEQITEFYQKLCAGK